METVHVLLVLLVCSVVLNVVLVRVQKEALPTIRLALEAAKKRGELASFWHRVAQEFQSLAMAKEGVKAILEGVPGIVMEHPDPAVQTEANKMMADLGRLAQKLDTARGLETRGSGADN